MTLPLAAVRDDIAGYVGTVIYVYTIILIVYLLVNLYLNFGGRVPYSRAFGAFITFLREVSEPFLALFRRFIPAMGPLDLSPIAAILVLSLGGRLITGLIAG